MDLGIRPSLFTTIPNMATKRPTMTETVSMPFRPAGGENLRHIMKFHWKCMKHPLKNRRALMVGVGRNTRKSGVVQEKKGFGLLPMERGIHLIPNLSNVKMKRKNVPTGRHGVPMNVRRMQPLCSSIVERVVGYAGIRSEQNCRVMVVL